MVLFFSFKDTLQMAAEASRLTDTSHLTQIEASVSCSKHNQVDAVFGLYNGCECLSLYFNPYKNAPS